MIKQLDRYIFKECLLATFGVISVLLIILLGNTLVRILSDIVEGKLPADTLLPMLLINLVHYLMILLPIGMYLGILFGMGRLYKDSEMAALYACGVSTQRLYQPILMLAIPVSIATLGLSLFLAPWTSAQQDAIKHKAEHQSELAGLAVGQFNESGSGKLTFFYERLNNEQRLMQQAFLHKHSSTDSERLPPSTVLSSATAVSLHKPGLDPYIVFQDGASYTGTPGQLDYRVTEFAAHGVQIKRDTVPSLRLKTSATPTHKLFGIDTPEVNAELHWRFAVPILSLLLAFLALPLSYTSPRKGRYAKLGMGILIYIILSNFLGMGRAWLERDLVPAWIGLWWVHGSLLLGTILLLNYQQRRWPFHIRAKRLKRALG